MDLNLKEEALNPNISGDRLREMFAVVNEEIRQLIAQNPNTPPEVLVELFERFPLQVL